MVETTLFTFSGMQGNKRGEVRALLFALTFSCIHLDSGRHAQTREFTELRGNSQNTGRGVVGAYKSGGMVEVVNGYMLSYTDNAMLIHIKNAC